MYNTPLFASKQTFARIDFFAPTDDWRAKMALIMLKKRAEKLTKHRLTS